MSDAPDTFDHFVRTWCSENVVSLHQCAEPRDRLCMYRVLGGRLQAAASAAGYEREFARAVLIDGAAAFVEQQYRQMGL